MPSCTSNRPVPPAAPRPDSSRRGPRGHAARLTLILLCAVPLAAQPGARPGAQTDERSAFQAAEQALRAGRLDEARSGFQAILKRNPRHLAALANLGVVEAQARNYAAAEQSYRRALKLAPDHPLLHLNLGLALFKQDLYPEAAREFEQTLARSPSHTQAQELLAACHVHTGAAARALPVLTALLQSRPAEPGLLYLHALALVKLNRHDEAQTSLRNLFAAAPPALAHFLAGKAHYENEAFDEAVSELEQARTLDPKLEGVHRELGKVFISLRRAQEAETALRAALAADPNDTEARYFLAGALVLQDRGGEALPLLDEVARHRPAFWGVHYYRGRILLGEGKAAEALPALEQAAKLNPTESSTFYQLARAYRAIGRSADATAALARLSQLKAQAGTQTGAPNDPALLRRK